MSKWTIAAALAAAVLVAPRYAPAAPRRDPGVIVYARHFSAGGGSALCVTDPDGSRTAVLESFDGIASSPEWSRDSSKVAFSLDSQIAILDLVTRSVTTIADGIDPSWSPDGTRLVYVLEDYLHVVDADGSEDTVLGPGRRPDWSPDGALIIFDQFPSDAPVDGPDGELKTMDPVSGEVEWVDYGIHPAWSRDGAEIAFTASSYWGAQVRVVDAGGTTERPLSKAVGEWVRRPGFPAWAPNGHHVVFSRDDELWTVAADGTGAARIVKHGGESNWGAMPPEGSHLWRGRACDDPTRFLSLHLYGHLFARGRVTTNTPSRCPVEDLDVTLWRWTERARKLAGVAHTDEQGRFDRKVRMYRGYEGKRTDLPGRYQARLDNAPDCLRVNSEKQVHRH